MTAAIVDPVAPEAEMTTTSASPSASSNMSLPSTPDSAAATTTPVRPQEVDHAVVRIRSVSCEGVGTGSGFLVDGSTVITARHVLEGASKVQIETWDGRQLEVDTVQQAQLVDIGVVSLSAPSKQAPLVLAAVNAVEADDVLAVGYPEGDELATSTGTVLGYFNDVRYGNLGQIMRFSAAIKPGNSGGPLLSADGVVVGVVYAVDLQNDDALAVPVDSLRRLLERESGLATVKPC